MNNFYRLSEYQRSKFCIVTLLYSGWKSSKIGDNFIESNPNQAHNTSNGFSYEDQLQVTLLHNLGSYYMTDEPEFIYCTSGKSCFYHILLFSSNQIPQVASLKATLVHGRCFELLGAWFGLALVKLQQGIPPPPSFPQLFFYWRHSI